MEAFVRHASWRFTDWLLQGFSLKLLLFASLATLVGFLITPSGFLGNLLAETFGTSLGILLTVGILERFYERRGVVKWTHAYNLTLKAMSAHLYQLFAELPRFFPKIYDGGPPLDIAGRSEADGRNSDAMRYAASQLAGLPRSDRAWLELSVDYYNRVSWDLDQIQAVLTPRILEAGAEQLLVEAIYLFDNCRRGLHHAVLGSEDVTDRLARLLRTSVHLDIAIAGHLRAEFELPFWQE